MSTQAEDLQRFFEALPAPTTAQKDCTHPQHAAFVAVNRMLDSGLFCVDVRIRCVECGIDFRFTGLPSGVHPTQPMVSIDGTELRAPIEPETETRLHETASFTMPAIPTRH